MRVFKTLLLALVMTLGYSTSGFAADDPIYTGLFSNKALRGYDTVAYFTEGKPVKGSSKYKTGI